MEQPRFSEHDVNVLLAALHNHVVKKRIRAEEAYELQNKILGLIGQSIPITLEEAKEIARTVHRGR